MERFIKDGSNLRHHMAKISKFISDGGNENAAFNGTKNSPTNREGKYKSVGFNSLKLVRRVFFFRITWKHKFNNCLYV